MSTFYGMSRGVCLECGDTIILSTKDLPVKMNGKVEMRTCNSAPLCYKCFGKFKTRAMARKAAAAN